MKKIIGNQKTYLNKDEVIKFIDSMKIIDCKDTVICPSYIYIDLFSSSSNFIVGSQNVSEKKNGAATGEISAEQLKSMGVKYSIVGHSERRDLFKETGDTLCNKMNMLLDNSIIPVFCVGEHLSDKENGTTKDVVGKQILEVFDKLPVDGIEKIIIAYEPVWAIGSGLVPKCEEIDSVTCYIKDLVKDNYGVSPVVLYGGSVSKGNIEELNTIDIVDGYLIGGASTKTEEFLYIMRESSK